MEEHRATLDQLQSFLDSNVWNDMAMEIRTWLDDIRDQLEAATDRDELNHLQGNAKACRHFLALPYTMIENIQEGQSNGRADRSE